MEKKEKKPAPVPTSSTTPLKVKPKKRRGCLVAVIIIGAVLVFLFFVSRFFPLLGLFGGHSDSDLPISSTDSNKDAATDTSKDQAKITTPKKSTSTSPGAPTYSKDEYINYFTQLATRNGTDTLGRFTKSPVYLKVEGNVPAGSDEILNNVISDFNGLSNSVKIERNQGGNDIQIVYVTRAELDNYRSPGSTPTDAFEVEIPNADCSYKYAKIYIGYDVMDINNLDATIRHELTHTIGFKGHISPSTVNSVMANRMKISDYPPLDQVLIQMLYNMGVPLCANSAGISSFFAGWNP